MNYEINNIKNNGSHFSFENTLTEEHIDVDGSMYNFCDAFFVSENATLKEIQDKCKELYCSFPRANRYQKLLKFYLQFNKEGGILRSEEDRKAFTDYWNDDVRKRVTGYVYDKNNSDVVNKVMQIRITRKSRINLTINDWRKAGLNLKMYLREKWVSNQYIENREKISILKYLYSIDSIDLALLYEAGYRLTYYSKRNECNICTNSTTQYIYGLWNMPIKMINEAGESIKTKDGGDFIEICSSKYCYWCDDLACPHCGSDHISVVQRSEWLRPEVYWCHQCDKYWNDNEEE